MLQKSPKDWDKLNLEAVVEADVIEGHPGPPTDCRRGDVVDACFCQESCIIHASYYTAFRVTYLIANNDS